MSENYWKDKTDDELVAEGGTYQSGEGAKAELQRRLMESIRGLDESTGRYSRVIIILTVVLFIVAFLQLAVAVFSLSVTILIKFSVLFGVILIIGIGFWYISKDFLK